MRRRPPDSLATSVRYALLVLIFCVLNIVALAHAKFALLTNSELHAYWMGRYGYFPFRILPWSEHHFGGNALAMRLPLLAVFALMLALVLLGLNRMVLRKISAMTLTILLAVALFSLGVQQVFALKKLRAERRALFALRDRVERAAAPGEIIVVDSNLAMPLYTYGSHTLQQQLRAFLGSFPDVPPVNNLGVGEQDGEIIYVGAAQDALGSYTLPPGYSIRACQPAQPNESELVAQYYQAPGASIYFVSPPAKDATAEVLSKP